MIAVHYDSDIIPQDDILVFEPYVVIGMPALSIIYNILYSLDCDGIRLLNGDIMTEQKCPVHKNLFKKLIEVKNMIKNKNLSDDQITLLKYKVVNNPSIEIPNELESINSSEIMNIVSKIIDIALDISKLYEFKKNIVQFLK